MFGDLCWKENEDLKDVWNNKILPNCNLLNGKKIKNNSMRDFYLTTFTKNGRYILGKTSLVWDLKISIFPKHTFRSPTNRESVLQFCQEQNFGMDWRWELRKQKDIFYYTPYMKQCIFSSLQIILYIKQSFSSWAFSGLPMQSPTWSQTHCLRYIGSPIRKSICN